jgi:hypothetical protein
MGSPRSRSIRPKAKGVKTLGAAGAALGALEAAVDDSPQNNYAPPGWVTISVVKTVTGNDVTTVRKYLGLAADRGVVEVGMFRVPGQPNRPIKHYKLVDPTMSFNDMRDAVTLDKVGQGWWTAVKLAETLDICGTSARNFMSKALLNGELESSKFRVQLTDGTEIRPVAHYRVKKVKGKRKDLVDLYHQYRMAPVEAAPRGFHDVTYWADKYDWAVSHARSTLYEMYKQGKFERVSLKRRDASGVRRVMSYYKKVR